MTDHYCDKCHCERVPVPMDIGYVEWLCPECELYHEREESE